MEATAPLPATTIDEREVLAAMLQHPACAAVVADLLPAEYFFDDAYRALADEMIRQEKAGGIDPQLVAAT